MSACHKQEDGRCAYAEGYGAIVHHFTRLWEVGGKNVLSDFMDLDGIV